MEIKEINERYSKLASSDCCLSCGGAINYSEALPGETCIDLGSGRGTDVFRLADMVGSNGFVYGIDVSEGMLEKAKADAVKFAVENVSFIKCDLEQLALPDRVADLIISNCTLNHAANKQAVWNEIHRVLKKGGRFVISDIYATQPIDDQYRNDPVAVAECWAGAVTCDEYMKQMANAGFDTVEIIEQSNPYPKGNAEVVSFTIAGKRSQGCGCGCSH